MAKSNELGLEKNGLLPSEFTSHQAHLVQQLSLCLGRHPATAISQTDLSAEPVNPGIQLYKCSILPLAPRLIFGFGEPSGLCARREVHKQLR